MAATWPLSRIRARVRTLTGRPTENQISDSDIDDFINDFYVNRLPVIIDLPEAEDFYSFDTVADTGTYTVPQDIIDIRDFTIDEGDEDVVDPLTFWHDRTEFFKLHPEDDSADTQQPTDIIWLGTLFYVRPIPDAVYTIKGWAKRRPTTELTADDSLPLQSSWGLAIAYGAAIDILNDSEDDEAAARLTIRSLGYDEQINLIVSKEISRLVGVRARPQI